MEPNSPFRAYQLLGPADYAIARLGIIAYGDEHWGAAPQTASNRKWRKRMDLILIILVLILLFGGGFGYSRWGNRGGIGIGGILLIILIVYLLMRHA
jgi:hypothetical protein